jgi:N-acetylmuramoyl-L-alanine amidase
MFQDKGDEMEKRNIFLIIKSRRIYFIASLVIIMVILFLLPSWAFQNVINIKIRPLNNKTIVLDPGHGGIDGGTSFGDILEKNINLTIGLKLKEELVKRGANVIMTREIDDSLDDHIDNGGSRHREDLNTRVNIVNDNNADLFISIHVNHTKNKNKVGPIVFYGEGDEESKDLAAYIQDYLNKLSAYDKMHIKLQHSITTGNYYTLSNISQPGVIVEMGFISSELDRDILLQEEHQSEIAELITRSIIAYFNGDRGDK